RTGRRGIRSLRLARGGGPARLQLLDPALEERVGRLAGFEPLHALADQRVVGQFVADRFPPEPISLPPVLEDGDARYQRLPQGVLGRGNLADPHPTPVPARTLPALPGFEPILELLA